MLGRETGGPSDAILRCGSGRHTGFASCTHHSRAGMSERAESIGVGWLAHGVLLAGKAKAAREKRVVAAAAQRQTQCMEAGVKYLPELRVWGRPYVERAAQPRRQRHHQTYRNTAIGY